MSAEINPSLLPKTESAPHAGISAGPGPSSDKARGEKPGASRGTCEIRVRYAETDRMGLLHHANYLVYFEQARTELLRDLGYTYRDMEDQGYWAHEAPDGRSPFTWLAPFGRVASCSRRSPSRWRMRCAPT